MSVKAYGHAISWFLTIALLLLKSIITSTSILLLVYQVYLDVDLSIYHNFRALRVCSSLSPNKHARLLVLATQTNA